MRKNKKFKRIVIILILIIVLLGAGVGYLYMQYKNLTQENASLTSDLDSNTQTVYVATTYIEKGVEIVADGEDANVELQTIRTGLEDYNYITDSEIGNVAITDIPEGLPVMYNMVSSEEFDADTRVYELAVVNLATDQNEFDVVDVRIAFPNGEDYIVLAKKEVRNLNLENCVFSCLCNEEEILRMSSAIVDAYTTTGAYLYTTKYVESNIQEDAIPTYPVKSEVIDLINSDANVLTKAINTLNVSARLSLENRLGTLTDDQLTAVSEGRGLQDTAKGAVLQNNTAEVLTEDAGETTDTETEVTEEETEESEDTQ